jgi:hypothetical protein
MRWQDERCGVLDSLEAVHEHFTGKRRGRQTATEHLNLALFVRLAAESRASAEISTMMRR